MSLMQPSTTFVSDPLSFADDWTRIAGSAFGIAQGVLRGRMSVSCAVVEDERADALYRWMEEVLEDHECQRAASLEGPIALAHRALYWSMSVQRQSGIPLCRQLYIAPLKGGLVEGAVSQAFFAATPCAYPGSGKAALDWARRTICAFLSNANVPVTGKSALEEEFDALVRLLSTFAEPGQNRAYFAQHAYDAGIPLSRVAGGVIRLGTGRHGRVFDSSITGVTPAIGVGLARKKPLSAAVLRSMGLPAPDHRPASDVAAALHAARTLGFPVVVKPADQDGGVGVFADLRDEQSVAKAFQRASEVSRSILVEKHFDGQGHRLTVFDGAVIKATRKTPGGVTGDGVNTVVGLIAQLQETARQKRRTGTVQGVPLLLDEEAQDMLVQQGLSAESVPEDGRFVCLRRRNNASAGGSTTLLPLESVHPDNLRLAVRAARALLLDWAGVDLLIPDISVSWLETGALICEVNAQPQVDPITAADVVDSIMRGGVRIPVHLVVCAEGDVVAARDALREEMARLGCNGFSSSAGVWIDGERVTPRLRDGFVAGRALLQCSDVEAALCVMTPEEIGVMGLPVDRFDTVRMLQSSRIGAKNSRIMKAVNNVVKFHADPVRSGARSSSDGVSQLSDAESGF
jgi:cyanophycin synthetase